MMKHLRVFTCVWGSKHIEWFKRGCIKSLSMHKNAEALSGCTWVFVTKEEHRDELEKILNDSQIKYKNVEFLILGPDFDKNPHAGGAYMLHALLDEIGKCITYNAQSLTAPPDTVFSDGSIHNMREIARQRDSCVATIHTRVLPEILDDLDFTNLPGAKLVGKAWKHLHKTWEEAQDGLLKVNSYVGGVSWKYLDENLFAVTHRLPTCYLNNFTPEDLVFFKNQIHYGIFDHSWPHECLIHTERLRVIGSSDASFMVELTESDKNIPPVEHYREDEPDMFWRNLSHNKHNRMYSVILRGEN